MLATRLRRFGWLCFAILWLPFAAIFLGMIGLPSGDYAWHELPRLAQYGIIGSVTCAVLSLGSMLLSLIVGWIANRSVRVHGRSAVAKILSIRDTGTTVNQSPLVHLKLRVEPADAPAFEADAEQLLNRLQIPQFQPGANVAVRYDPDSHEVALDLRATDRTGPTLETVPRVPESASRPHSIIEE